MNHAEVAQFLTTHPRFFEEHAELLGTIKLSSPLLGRAISLQERQIEIIRDKCRQLELRLSELLHLAQENELTAAKLHRWTNSLLMAKNDTDLPLLLLTNLKEFFSLPYASLRLWNVAEEYQQAWFASPVSEDLQLFVRSMHVPFCGENNDFEAARWINGPVSSLAMLPLCIHNKSVGLLVLASPEKNRYTSTMSTEFLSQISAATSAALAYLITQ